MVLLLEEGSQGKREGEGEGEGEREREREREDKNTKTNQINMEVNEPNN